jgi:hypothetical protein
MIFLDKQNKIFHKIRYNKTQVLSNWPLYTITLYRSKDRLFSNS